jgi:Tfp pilus assembly protein PilF
MTWNPASLLALRSLALLLVVGAAAVTCACSGGGGDDEEAYSERAAELYEQGVTAHTEGNLVEAERLFTELIKLDPSNAPAFYYLSLVEQSSAEQHRRQALSLDPNVAG